MLPDVSDVLIGWEIDVTLKVITTLRVDGEPTNTVTPSTIKANVQPAEPSDLKAFTVDIEKDYITVWYRGDLTKGDYIEHGGTNYKIIKRLDWQVNTDGSHGFTKALCEEYKGTL